MVLTINGYKELANLNVGEKLIGINGVENEILNKRFFDREWFVGQEVENQFKWYLINGTEKVFHNQNIFVREGDYNVCHAFELLIGWKIIDSNGNDLIINSIEETTEEIGWWSVELSGDHSFISDGLILHNATRYWVGGGASANWNATGNTNWSATDGGSNNASVPTTTDDVTLNGNGVNANTASTISATITILSLTITSGYTNTMTHNAILTIAGNWSRNGTYIVAGASGITISAASTITSNGLTWANALTFSGTNTTKTLVGNLVVTGLFTISSNNTTTINKTTSETLTLNGGFTCGGITSGTADIILGGGTWSSTNSLANNLTISGNVTISGSVSYTTGTLTYTSGSITTTSSTLTLGGSCTLNTSGITWNNITLSAGTITITNNSLLTATGTLNFSGTNSTYIFTGTSGFTVGTLTTSQVQVNTITLKNGLTYTVTTAFNAFLSRSGSILTFTSDHAANTAALTLSQGATCNVLASFTRIDASGGRPIMTFNGTLTGCTNIIERHDFVTKGY